MPKLGGTTHSYKEREDLYQGFLLWYFSKDREPETQREWAEKNKVHARTLSSWKQRPEFQARIDTFRVTYKEDADEAVRNLLRFAVDPSPKVALPAIKIVMDVFGYTAPIRVEHSATGMSVSDYVAFIANQALGDQGAKAIMPPTIEGEFKEQPEPEPADVWETADDEEQVAA